MYFNKLFVMLDLKSMIFLITYLTPRPKTVVKSMQHLLYILTSSKLEITE